MKRTEADTTITIDDDEVDVRVRAYVELHRGPGHYGLRLDGDAEVFTGGEWLTTEELDLDSEDVERITESLCDAAEREAA